MEELQSRIISLESAIAASVDTEERKLMRQTLNILLQEKLEMVRAHSSGKINVYESLSNPIYFHPCNHHRILPPIMNNESHLNDIFMFANTVDYFSQYTSMNC
jgi:UDP-glucose 4-epimerase